MLFKLVYPKENISHKFLIIHIFNYPLVMVTVGADKNGTLIFVHFSAQAASISISSVAIIKRRS